MLIINIIAEIVIKNWYQKYLSLVWHPLQCVGTRNVALSRYQIIMYTYCAFASKARTNFPVWHSYIACRGKSERWKNKRHHIHIIRFISDVSTTIVSLGKSVPYLFTLLKLQIYFLLRWKNISVPLSQKIWQRDDDLGRAAEQSEHS